MLQQQVNDTALTPALALLPERMDSIPARRMLLAIGLQESLLVHRRQFGNGPARGLWQFEPGNLSALGGIFRLDATREYAESIAVARGAVPTWQGVYPRLEHDDVLAAGMARLLLWTHPRALPEDPDEGWRQYIDLWRPGEPHPGSWPRSWSAAQRTVG